MAQSICTRLQKTQIPLPAGDSDINDQFENLLRLFHHYRGELNASG